jgi:hypothetical protein
MLPLRHDVLFVGTSGSAGRIALGKYRLARLSRVNSVSRDRGSKLQNCTTSFYQHFNCMHSYRIRAGTHGGFHASVSIGSMKLVDNRGAS